MATSTFYNKIVIEEQAAKILAKGLKESKSVRPNVPEGMKWERDEELLELARLSLRKLSQTKMKR